MNTFLPTDCALEVLKVPAMMNIHVYLWLTEIPVDFIRPLENQEIFEKQTATFECEVNKPKQIAEWKQKADVITPGVEPWQRFSVETDGNVHRLVISDAQMSDASKYTCHIKDTKTSGKLVVKGRWLNSCCQMWLDHLHNGIQYSTYSFQTCRRASRIHETTH